MQQAVFILGCPAAGKTTLASGYVEQGYVRLNRDLQGGRTLDLLAPFKAALKSGQSVVLDNLFTGVEDRRPFLEAAAAAQVPALCKWVMTSLEDAQINVLTRQWRTYGRLFMDARAIKDSGHKDPGLFPVSVLFAYRKNFQAPTLAEGFSKIEAVPFVRTKNPTHHVKAVILDYDGTVRATKPGSAHPYPTNPDEIEIMPNRAAVLAQYLRDGYIILGASNQSGVAKGEMTDATCALCFTKTNELLGIPGTEVAYCPHSVPPSCYCRKPQSAQGVYLIEKYLLDPSQCIYVGDSTTDKTFAKRLGFQFDTPQHFFKSLV